MKLRPALATIVSAMLLAACGLTANTRISASDGTPKHTYHKLAVIAMSGSKAERQVFDDALVARLAAVGVEGIVGDRYIEDAASANGVAPMDAIRAAHADGVLYVWLHADSDRNSFVPGTWAGATGAWYTTGQVTVSRFEARLYDVDTQALAWSGSTTTFYPKTLAIDAPPIADAFVAALVKRGFIATRH